MSAPTEIPLFVEEEEGVNRKRCLRPKPPGGRRPIAVIPPPALEVPASLHASLVLARFDELGPAKEVAQIGAAIGREFSYELISAVASLSKADLNDMLEHLTASGLVFRRGTVAQATYSFKHVLGAGRRL